MGMPTKQATDKDTFRWNRGGSMPDGFVTQEGPYDTPVVGQANPGTGDSQRIKKPSFETTDKGD